MKFHFLGFSDVRWVSGYIRLSVVLAVILSVVYFVTYFSKTPIDRFMGGHFPDFAYKTERHYMMMRDIAASIRDQPSGNQIFPRENVFFRDLVISMDELIAKKTADGTAAVLNRFNKSKTSNMRSLLYECPIFREQLFPAIRVHLRWWVYPAVPATIFVGLMLVFFLVAAIVKSAGWAIKGFAPKHSEP